MLKLDVKKYVDEQFDNLNQFAKATGLNYQAAQKIYNGETTRITFDNLESICKTLNVTPNDIFVFEDNELQTKNKIIKPYRIPSSETLSLHSVKINPKNPKEGEYSGEVLRRLIKEIVDNSIEEQLKQYTLNIKNEKDDDK